MHHRTVERLACGDGLLHRRDARVKILSALALVVSTTLLPSGPAWLYLGPATLAVGLLLLARLPWGFVLSRTAMVLPFVLLVAVFLPWTHGRTVLWSAGPQGPKLFREGLALAASVAAKGVLALLWVELVVFTTPMMELLGALRKLRVPRVIVETLAFLFRYLDIMVDEGERVRRARLARSPAGTRRLRWRSAGGLVGRTLLRALDRAERVWRAMLARSYRGEMVVLHDPRLQAADAAVLVVFVLLAAGFFTLGRWCA